MSRIRHHLKNAFIPHAGNEYRPHALRHPWLGAYAIVVVAAKVIAVIAISFYGSIAHVADVTPAAIIAQTNQARVQRKAPALKSNALLAKAAESKAQDMARRQYFAHISPSGVTPWYWFKQAGYSYTYAGENLALDFVSTEDVLSAWLQSPSHRSNLLSTKYKDIGVAVTTAKINGATSMIVVQMFGAPLPPPTTKKVTTPVQVPAPAAAKKQVVATTPVVTTPPTKVLGEAAQNVVTPTPVAPTVPTVVTPGDASVVRTQTPDIIGHAEPGSVVHLLVNSLAIATTTTGADGVYTLTPTAPLSDGIVSYQVTATARGLTSAATTTRSMSIDTEPPVLTTQHAVVLPSMLIDNGYDVLLGVDGASSVMVASGGAAAPLIKQGTVYVGTLQRPEQAVGGALTIQAVDPAGNQIRAIIADPDMFTIGVVASHGGPLVNALRVVFYSRAFLLSFLSLIFLASFLNVVVEWRHQHHPTIIASLLVVFLGSAMLFI